MMVKKNECALDMLKAALKMEENGKVYYDKAASSCKNATAREIFKMLSKEETEHKKHIEKIHGRLSEGLACTRQWQKTTQRKKDLTRVFKRLAKKHGAKIKIDTSDIQALAVGIDLELQSLKFYEEQLGQAQDPLEKEFLRNMIADERSHYLALSDMNFYLTDISAWFIEHEHHTLDGA